MDVRTCVCVCVCVGGPGGRGVGARGLILASFES